MDRLFYFFEIDSISRDPWQDLIENERFNIKKNLKAIPFLLLAGNDTWKYCDSIFFKIPFLGLPRICVNWKKGISRTCCSSNGMIRTIPDKNVQLRRRFEGHISCVLTHGSFFPPFCFHFQEKEINRKCKRKWKLSIPSCGVLPKMRVLTHGSVFS